MIFLGIDLGSSSIKVSLFDAEKGKVIGSGHYPDDEQVIESPQQGWAEQKPEMWWENFKKAYKRVLKKTGVDSKTIKAIGISYQMHGLVTVDKDGQSIRPSIIWCDSRAVPYGNQAFNDLGKDYALEHLLNSPGNFTAAKLAWMKDNEPEKYEKIAYWFLPGDYFAFRFTGHPTTTKSGLSEGIFWDFERQEISSKLMDYYGFDSSHIPDIVPSIGQQGSISAETADELGLSDDVKITYRAGDQPNNAFSLDVVRPGEVAATAGTSGVIYAVTDKNMYDQKSRINTFLHVSNNDDELRNGVLICVNGTGILYSWLKKILNTGGEHVSYDKMNTLVKKADPGASGLKFYPFGNGAERVLGNKVVNAHLVGIDFNIHKAEHLVRAGMEGIIYALMIGFDIMQDHDFDVKSIKAGHANLFLSETFRDMFANITKTPVELFDTDGAAGAARGAALGYGFYNNFDETFESLQKIDHIDPDNEKMDRYAELYDEWKQSLPLKN
ncbi:MAG TPA: FGGY family carbohydrate kinase [Balneolales bacterium]|nr:FGGY family carbohydrate kinase [Balneolales bacterium]